MQQVNEDATPEEVEDDYEENFTLFLEEDSDSDSQSSAAHTPLQDVDLANQEEAINNKKDAVKQKEGACQEVQTSTVEEKIEKGVKNATTEDEQGTAQVESIKATPELEPDSIITAEFAKYATVSVVSAPSLEQTMQTAKKFDTIPDEISDITSSRQTSSVSPKQKSSGKGPTEVSAQKSKMDASSSGPLRRKRRFTECFSEYHFEHGTAENSISPRHHASKNNKENYHDGPDIYIEEIYEEDAMIPQAESTSFSTRPGPAIDPLSTEGFEAMEKKRIELEKQLSEIKKKLNVVPPTQRKRISGIINPTKIRHRVKWATPRSTPPPATRRHSSVLGEDDTTSLIQSECILPHDLPPSHADLFISIDEPLKADPSVHKHILPDLVCQQNVVVDPVMSLHPATEKLATFSLPTQNSGDSSIGLGKFSNFRDSSIIGTNQSELKSKTAPASLPQNTPPPLTSSPPIAPKLKTVICKPTSNVKRIPRTEKGDNRSGPNTTKLSETEIIQQQRMFYSSLGVNLPFVTKTNTSANALVTTACTSLVSNDGVLQSTVSPVASIQNLQSQFAGFKVPCKQTEENEPKVPDLRKFQQTAPHPLFPKIRTAEVSSAQSQWNATQSLKIIFEAITGQQRELCPNGASILLPLPSIDGKWCLVALNHIPNCGFIRVPGLSVFIPRGPLDRAASAVIEYKHSVFLPIRLQTTSHSTFKSVFGVYGAPQLPRHVFVGPFPSNYIESFSPPPCMILIDLTEPVPSGSGYSNASGNKLDPQRNF